MSMLRKQNREPREMGSEVESLELWMRINEPAVLEMGTSCQNFISYKGQRKKISVSDALDGNRVMQD